MSVMELNNVKVFNLSSGKSLSQFTEESIKTKKSLRYNTEFKNRLELIQDFEFPTASSHVRVAQDGEYIAASGVYPPQIRMFETEDLSMKFQRNFDSETIQFTFLTSDYRKLAVLGADRSIELHAQYGKHYSTRIPRFGRDMAYNPYNCELMIVGATNESYRLNLEQGRFMAPLESQVCGELNVCGFLPGLKWVFGTGGNDGFVECWDTRSRERAALLDAKQGEITALKFDSLLMATGHANGVVNLFDIRSPRVLHSITHKNRLPIKSVYFHGDYFLSTDSKAIKISNKETSQMVTTIESQTNINDIECIENTGLIFTANETQRVGIYYIPLLGPAPKWCSFVDALNDEIEEQKVNILDNKQFVTVEELEKLNGSDLIGTEMLAGYMHGYLLDSKLYYKLKALAEPFDYKEYKKERIAKKLEEKTAERITIKKKLPKVNKTFAAVIQKDETQSKHPKAKEIMEDDRFKDMFFNEEFEINQESDDFRRLNRRRMEERVNEDRSEEDEVIDEDEEIVPKLKKKKKVEGELIEEPDEDGGDKIFKERFEEKVEKVKRVRNKEKKSKILKQKPDLVGRRTAVPMQRFLRKPKPYSQR
ncbi:hypothetical protein SteCoe_21072 [Stentor coeruleus]|uniref:Uncharacterized protein n=1 Tax=Stentor coeruleus TaxID=5963 RepID=A0A1R2BQF3_9CILI|nr:hypothetical protein SteCoe_21072 [Stentor coeruleus]